MRLMWFAEHGAMHGLSCAGSIAADNVETAARLVCFRGPHTAVVGYKRMIGRECTAAIEAEPAGQNSSEG